VNDGPIRDGGREIVDNSGKVYDIKGDHAEEEIPNPRDSIGMEPVAGYMGGGAGGIATSVADTTADTDDDGMRATSESGPHGSVAESADLGQRPLRDYKRDADPSMDATDTTMSATHGSTGPIDSSVSDGDMVDRSVGDSTRGVSTATSGTMAGDSMAGGTLGPGTTILDTSRDRFDDASATIRGESGDDMGQNASGMAAGGGRVMSESRTTMTGGMGGDASGADRTASTGGTGRDSMSLDNDNTSPLGDVSTTETLTNVREGMKVIDSSGDDIGTVRTLKSGDTSSATVDDAGGMAENVGVIAVPGGTGTGGSTGIGAGSGIPGVFGTTAGGGDEPNVDEPAYSRLTRVGFIKIDSKGFFASDRYAGADQVDRVDGDTVYLSVGKDDLIS